MTQKNIFNIIAVIAIVLITLRGANWYYGKQNEADKIALRKQRIKTSELTQLKEGLYTKLVADTLTIKDLKRVNDSLALELDNPTIVTVVEWKYKEVEKPVDSVVVKDSTLQIVDTYPSKDNPFVTYRAEVNKFTGEGLGKFSFNPQEVRLGIGENEDGTYSVNAGVPDYLTITGLDVQSRPLEPVKIDNFGWIAGARIGKDFTDLSSYFKVNGGIRYKKLYFIVGAGTNGTVEGGIDIEL